METFRDKARAFGLALLVHLGVVAVLLLGLFWTQSEVKPISLPGPVIEAELVGISAAPRPRAPARAKPKPAQPEPPKPPEPKPEPPAQPTRNDQIEREKVAEIAQQKAEQAQRAEQERHRQEQVLLEKQLEEVKREHAEAQKKLKLEKEKLAQLQDLQKKPVKPVSQAVPEAEQARTGMAGQDDSLQAQYFAAIQNAVTNNWLRPDNTPGGVRCMLRIVQIPGGDVIGVQIANPCNADPQTRNSIEQAVKRAAPLPYKGYEKVFSRDINFNFTYDG